jgi:hypothetical protein
MNIKATEVRHVTSDLLAMLYLTTVLRLNTGGYFCAIHILNCECDP